MHGACSQLGVIISLPHPTHVRATNAPIRVRMAGTGVDVGGLVGGQESVATEASDKFLGLGIRGIRTSL
jgi:hypothetical protein